MNRVAALLIVLLVSALPASAAPQDAVVRIISHGCSGTVIATSPGRSMILTCAHAWEKPSDRVRKIVIDAPSPVPGGTSIKASPRMVAISLFNQHTGSGLDLALIEMSAGPLPYVCKVAPRGAPARVCLSAGYDEMKWPMTTRRATVTRTDSTLTWTVEAPWLGRSGGALISEQGFLVGVVQGYDMDRSGRPLRGLYASHAAVLSFLSRHAAPTDDCTH